MTTTTTDRRDFERALEMERGQLAAASQRAEPHPLGLLLFDDARPRVWVHNQLHVTGPAGDIDDLVRVLDEHYGHLQHRRVVVEDEVEGERLADGFRNRGWETAVTVYMALREPRDRDPEPGLAEEVSAAEHLVIELETMGEEPYAKDEEVRRQLIDARAARQAIVDKGRFIAGVVDARRVGNTAVYVVGDIAQVEDVATLTAFRRRGVARAMVSLATDLAQDEHADLVWIAADEHDWPKELYFKLGFRPVGHIHSFTRVGPEHPSYDPAAR
jgi:ribosomal protein S18 acetylase RimI-like enzyme